MIELNAWLCSSSIAGISFMGLTRHFHHGSPDNYGRLHAPFQNTRSDARRYLIKTGGLMIDGHGVAEIDIKSSQPQLLYGRYQGHTGEVIEDLYLPVVLALRELGYIGVTRETAKNDVVQIIGNKGPVKRTHSKLHDPFKVRRQRAVVEAAPWLKSYVEDKEFSQANLVNLESRAMLQALHSLKASGLPALPIHDCLLVSLDRPDAISLAKAAMESAWRHAGAIGPLAELKVRGPS